MRFCRSNMGFKTVRHQNNDKITSFENQNYPLEVFLSIEKSLLGTWRLSLAEGEPRRVHPMGMMKEDVLSYAKLALGRVLFLRDPAQAVWYFLFITQCHIAIGF